MAARTIVTLHPDVECGVCGRRLLRGERPNFFLGGGQRHTVCELCTPRATHEGWRREVEGQSAAPRAPRPQRGRSLLGRLRQLREPARDLAGGGTASFVDEGHSESAPGVLAHGPRRTRTRGRTAEWAKMEPEWAALDEEWVDRDIQPATAEHVADVVASELAVTDASLDEAGLLGSAQSSLELQGTPALQSSTAGIDHDVLRALEIFNGGSTPRRIASVARALGEACVHVARDSERESVVAIVVAWELCWYRYELDLDDATSEVHLTAEGTELEELPAELRIANVVADEHGTLSLLAA